MKHKKPEVARTFYAALDDKIIIPQVFKDYSSRYILTLSLEQGESIETAVSTWSQRTRNTLGSRLLRAMVKKYFI